MSPAARTQAGTPPAPSCDRRAAARRSRRFAKRLGAVFATVLLLLPPAAPAGGVVSNLNGGTLRAAVSGGGAVTFAASGTIVLTTPLEITSATTVNGSGFAVTLSGGTNTSLFRVASNLTLMNLTLANGRATNGGGLFIQPGATLLATNCIFTGHQAVGSDGADGADGANTSGIGKDGSAGGAGSAGLGGAIFNQGQLTLLACQFHTNGAIGGLGGPGGAGGKGDFQGGNGARGGAGGAAYGGAVYSPGALVVSNCSFTWNDTFSGHGAGGGAAGNGAFVGISGNGGAGGAARGAALYCLASATIVNSTFYENYARGGDSAAGGQQSNSSGTRGAAGGDAAGAGLYCGGIGSVTNSTFSANSVVGGDGGNGGNGPLLGGDGGRGGYGMGGGACNAGTLRLVHCTLVSGNSLGGFGGEAGSGPFPGTRGADAPARGANVANDGGALLLKNSLLAYPASGTNRFLVTNVVSTVTSVATNLLVLSTNTFGLVNGQCGELGLPPACFTNLVFTNGAIVSTNVFFLTNCAGPQLPATCFTNLIFTNLVTSNFNVVVLVTNVVSGTNIGLGFNADGTITDAGHNLSSDASPTFGGGSRNNRDPKLGELANNGGPTRTYRLNSGSPALNAGDDTAALPFDQRGAARPTGGRSDIGAVEMGGPVIQSQPKSQVIVSGANALFSVTATGEEPPAYQWRFNGTSLAGATGPTYALAGAQPSNSGDYTVAVANPFGVVTSQVATLTVTFRPELIQPSLPDRTHFAFAFTTRAGHAYFVEFKTNLTDGSWTRLNPANYPGTGGWLTNVVPTAGVPSRFFRVVEQ